MIYLSYLQYHHWPLLLSQWDSKVDISKWVLTLKKNTWGWFFPEPRLGPDMGTVHPGDPWVWPVGLSQVRSYGLWVTCHILPGWVGAGRKILTGTPTCQNFSSFLGIFGLYFYCLLLMLYLWNWDLSLDVFVIAWCHTIWDQYNPAHCIVIQWLWETCMQNKLPVYFKPLSKDKWNQFHIQFPRYHMHIQIP